MKKILIFILLLSISHIIISQTNSNYILVINGDSIPINLNKDYKHKLNKKNVSIKLIQPLTLSYSDDVISFKYPNDLSVSKTQIEKSIQQLMVMTATGSGYMIQTYSGFDPSALTQLMVNEITKESVTYGYTKEEEEIEFNLVSGHVLKGLKATLKYKDDTEIYTVTAYGGKDEGIMVITMYLSNEYKNDDVINLLMDSLSIKDTKN